MSAQINGSFLGNLPVPVQDMPDEAIRAPLWYWEPRERPAVIHQRRVRFGYDDDEGLDHG